MIEEEWKLFKNTKINSNHGAIWEVSNFGRIKKNGLLYEPQLMNSDYLVFSHFLVHRVVAELFIPNPYNKPTVNHIDHNRTNNHISNLEWSTYNEQLSDPVRVTKWKDKRKNYVVSEDTRRKNGINSKRWWDTEDPKKIAARNKKISDWKKEWWKQKKSNTNISI